MSVSPQYQLDSSALDLPVRYRAVNPAAVASLVLGALSALTALWLPLAVIPLAGILLGWVAQRRILRAPEEWTGLRLARWGMAVSAVLWAVGSGVRLASTREVPYGYARITYEDLQSDPSRPNELIPEKATLMNDKKVYIKGYMQPRRTQSNIKDFVMTFSNVDCPFCIPNPKPTEMIRVMLQGDLVTNYTNHEIGVAGRLHVDPDAPGGLPYSIDGEFVR